MSDIGPNKTKKVFLYVAIILLSLVGVTLVFLSTSRYGVGVSPDSASYISAADSLVSGRGLKCYDGRPYTFWPPLFPLLLAAFGLVGIDPATAARLLNAFAMGGIALICGIMLSRSLKSTMLVVIGTGAVALSFPLLNVSSMAWTEPVFALLIALFILQMPALLRDHRVSGLVTVSVLAALCSLQRYAGVIVIASGAILILLSLSQTSVRKRFKYVTGFVVFSSAPLVLWAVRDRLLTGMFTGHSRVPSVYSLAENVTYALDTCSRWFMPETIPLSIRMWGLGLLILWAIAVIVLCRIGLVGPAWRNCPYVWPMSVVMLVYIPFIVYTHQVGVLDELLNDRYLSPVSAPLICLLFIAVDRTAILLSLAVPKRVSSWPAFVLILVCAVWLKVPFDRIRETVSRQMREGVPGYTTLRWQESALAKWLRDHSFEGHILSNAPDAVYVLVGIGASTSPLAAWDQAQFQEHLASEQDALLVWFNSVHRRSLCDISELIDRLCLEKVVTVPDGDVYRLRRPSPPRSFQDRFLSDYMVNGRRVRTFGSDTSGSRGVVTSWVLRPDGTTESAWRLAARDGAILCWEVSCPYQTHSDGTFEFHCEGRAIRDGSDAASAYDFTVRGTGDPNAAIGTYRIQFADPQWPAVDRGTWRVDVAQPIYRLYDSAAKRHLYVDTKAKVDELTRAPDNHWLDEGVCFYIYPNGNQPPGTQPVYGFFSRSAPVRFYTMSESEKTEPVDSNSDEWVCEGVVFYAYPQDLRADLSPIYRFRSKRLGYRLYTANEYERETLIQDYPDAWTYEGVAWYAYKP
jgi:hypothetical protein